MESLALDDIISRLLEVRGKPGKQVKLSESEIRQLCMQSKDIFMRQPNLLELEAPIKICGKFQLDIGKKWVLFNFEVGLVQFEVGLA
ncbi:hypothetical protein LguiA_001465 [Lonicera macranthoides]